MILIWHLQMILYDLLEIRIETLKVIWHGIRTQMNSM